MRHIFHRRAPGKPVHFLLLASLLTACGTTSATSLTLPTSAPLQAAGQATPNANTQSRPTECAQDSYGCAVIQPGETIKIGIAGPMSGPLENFGIDIADAAQLAVEDFGHYLSWDFELLREDSQGDPITAQNIANNWISDQTVVAIAGHIFSGETREVIPLYQESGIPMLSPSATGPELTQTGSTVFNRLAFTDTVQGKQAAEYMFVELGLRRLIIVHDGDSYGVNLATIVNQRFTQLGGEVISVNDLRVRSDTQIIQFIASDQPDGIYYGGYDEAAIDLLNALAVARTAYNETIPTPEPTPETAPDDSAEATPEPEVINPYDLIFFGCDGTFGQNLLTRVGPGAEGIFAASLTPPTSPVKDAFDLRYETVYGIRPGSRTPYTWHGYDATAALTFAVKQVAIIGNDNVLYIPRSRLIQAVRNLSGYPGLTGSITCDELGECSTSGPQFFVVDSGFWVQAP